jgi:hypothetical protein
MKLDISSQDLHNFILTRLDLTNELVWPVLLAQVLPRPQLMFPSKTWFLKKLFEFSVANVN